MLSLLKKLIVGASLALAPACLGCIVVADGVHPGDPINAHFTLTWLTVDGPSGAILDCHTIGADTVRVITTNQDTGDVFVDLFNCDLEHGRTDHVTAGHYAVTVDLVHCGLDASCTSAPAVAGTDLSDRFAVFAPGDYDLGHFDFQVD